MLSLKSILTESPDCISIPAMHGGGDEDDLDLIEFQDARFTFLVYPDRKDNKNQWVAFDYLKNKIITSSPGLKNDLYGTRGLYADDDIDDELDSIGNFPAHDTIRKLLSWTDRFEQVADRAILDGRLFERNGKWYFPFWQIDLPILLKENKSIIDDFLRTVGASVDRVYFEDEADERTYHSYDEVFGSAVRQSSSDEQRRMKQMQWDLHVKKGVLDKAIVRALQSRPKDVNTLYQRLEKEYGMPVAQIKHLYGAVPLDKLISKKAKELNEGLNKDEADWEPGKIIVGLVDDVFNTVSSDKVKGHEELLGEFPAWIEAKNSAQPWRFNKLSKTLFFWLTSATKNHKESVKSQLQKKGYTVEKIETIQSYKSGSYERELAKYNSHGGYVYYRKPTKPVKVKSYKYDVGEPVVAESVMPATRWVGVVKHDGAVILPPNQNGERQHYHYGLDGYPNRFSYWPHKKEVSWWNFPDEEELVSKVEDYLIRKGYPVERHVDYTGRKIRDSLNESIFKKMAEATLINDEIPEKLYHATWRPLLGEILEGGIIPGGKDTQNFDWAGKFVYLAETAENAISFVEGSENEDIPEEWFDDIVVLEVDVSKLDLTKMMPDENWNPATEEGEEGYRSFQYEVVVSPDAITVL